ncbi:MAG: hypothetical protein QM723_34595 [Myxococcaceae bacterium]
MGVDSIKSGGSVPLNRPQSDDVDVKGAEETVAAQAAAAAQPQQSVSPTQAEGFDDPKAKPVSVTGGYKAFTPNFPVRADLQADVAANRLAGGTNAKPLADAAKDTISTQGQAPAARTPDADFAAQAKAAGAKTPAEIEAKSIELGKAKIEKDFGMKVKDGDAKWSGEELSRAYESFKSMPAGDQAKLKGLDLIRDHAASPESQAEMGGKGIVAGEYSPNVDSKDGARVKPGSISAYDAAFPSGPDSRKTSISVLSHEAGHAVEGRARDDAMADFNQAIDNQNAKAAVTRTTSDANNTQWNATNAANQALGGASSKDKAKFDFVGAQKGVLNALDKVQKATTPKELSDAQADLAKAKTKRDAALTAMSGNKAEGKAQASVAETDKQEKTATDFANANIDFKAAKTVADGKKDVMKGLSTDATGKTSKEVDAFKKARGTEKPVSGYGATATAEGYAEAYALYQRDPAYMQKNFPKQYDYFHKNHQSPRDP